MHGYCHTENIDTCLGDKINKGSDSGHLPSQSHSLDPFPSQSHSLENQNESSVM